jgi:O-antigen/teichoic acid export membrane protein
MTATLASPLKLARHGTLYTIGVAVQGLATLMVLPFVTRILGAAEYGPVALGLSIIQVGAALTIAGLPIAITRVHFDPGDGPARSRALVGLVVGISVVVVTAALLLVPAVGVTIALPVATVGAVALVVAGQALLRARGRPLLFVLTAMGSTVGAHAVALVATALVDRTSTVYLAGYLVGAVVTAAATMVIAPPLLPWRVPGAMAEGLRIALPVLPHAAAILVLFSADPLIVTALLGVTDAGRYQVAMMLGMATLALLNGINNAWAPAIMSADAEDRWAFLARTVRPILMVGAVGSLGLALIAPIAVRVLAPSEFGHGDLAEVAQIISLCALPQAIYLGASAVLFNEKRTTLLAVSTPIAVGIYVVVAVVLVGQLGLLGMALAKLIGFVVLAVATLVVGRRAAHVPWRPARWLPVVGLTAGCVFALRFVPVTATALWVQAACAAALGAVFLTWLARFLRRRKGSQEASA